MAILTTGGSPAPGLSLANGVQYMSLATGVTCKVGDLLSVDMSKVKDSSGGDLRFYEVRLCVTADFASATTAYAKTYQCVALDASTVSGVNVRCLFMGEVDILTATGTSIGTALVPLTQANDAAAKAVTPVAGGTSTAGGTKVVAIAKVANSSGGNVIGRADFDGIAGLGLLIT